MFRMLAVKYLLCRPNKYLLIKKGKLLILLIFYFFF